MPQITGPWKLLQTCLSSEQLQESSHIESLTMHPILGHGSHALVTSGVFSGVTHSLAVPRYQHITLQATSCTYK